MPAIIECACCGASWYDRTDCGLCSNCDSHLEVVTEGLRAQLTAAEGRAEAFDRLALLWGEWQSCVMGSLETLEAMGDIFSGSAARTASAAPPAPVAGAVSRDEVRDFIVRCFGASELSIESGIADGKLAEEYEEITAAIAAWRDGSGSVEAIAKEAGDISLVLKVMGVILGFDLAAHERAKHERNLAATWEKLPDGRWKRVAALAATTEAHR